MRPKYFKLNLKTFLFSLASGWLLWVGQAQAASVFLEPGSYIESGQKFYEIKIYLNTENKSLNVFEGEMLYPVVDLNLEKTLTGGSVISLWVKSPDKSLKGRITFSGGIPNGYRGAKGFILSAIFSVPDDSRVSQSEISLQNLKAYLNDGQGTKISLANFKYTLNLEQAAPISLPIDTHAPEVFAPYVTQDPLLEGGQWMVIFNAQDKGEGIDHYEIYESRKKYDSEEILKKSSINWKTVESLKAYILYDQSLKSYIYVRAVDKAGNSRVAVVIPAYNQKSGPYDYEILLAIIILLIIAIVFFFKMFIFERKHRTSEDISDIK